MKKIILVIIACIIALLIIYINFPAENTRKNDIKFGNQLVIAIENYKIKNDSLPMTDDWETLKQLGFEIKTLGTKPYYGRINENEYELIYLEGFNSPYLRYNSKSDKWKYE